VRRYALGWSVPTILASLLVFFAINRHNHEHFLRMVDLSWMFVASFLCFLAALYLIWRGTKYGLAFVMVMLQFAFAFFGYGASHLPYLLYPFVKLSSSFTSETMAVALITAFIAGLLLLVPSLYLLMRLFLFDSSYVRGDQSKKG
jgi:cytochrome d ubiquinol oxidase subunit II